MTEAVTREAVRQQLRVYMSRAGLQATEVASRSGYSTRTVIQFISGARFGNPSSAPGLGTAAKLAAWMEENPPALPELPGKLYETAATQEIDRMIEHALEGGWGTIYGPAGAQKTFMLKYRAAEAAREQESRLVLVEGESEMSPRELLGRISCGVAAPYAWSVSQLRESILYTLRRRRRPVAIAVDEAQLLYRRTDTLETLRRLGDRSNGKVGILICGNEQARSKILFGQRRNVYFEQWRSRIEQEEASVLGPTPAEARKIVREELPWLRDAATEKMIAGTTVNDPISNTDYVSARRLFNTIRTMQRDRTMRKN